MSSHNATDSTISSRTPRTNITVLISGSGTNLQALIDAVHKPSSTSTSTANPTLSLPPNTHITHVISNKREAFGLVRATKAGIPTTYHNLIAGGYTKRFPNPDGSKSPSKEAREAYDADLAALILDPSSTNSTSDTATPPEIPRPNLIICAGWMHVLSPNFLTPFATSSPPIPIINLHPALPSAYNGSHAIQRAHADYLAGKTKKTGVMIHYVIDEVDMGEPIEVEEVEMREGESLEELESRIHGVEHGIIVRGTRRAVEKLMEERRRNDEKKVR